MVRHKPAYLIQVRLTSDKCLLNGRRKCLIEHSLIVKMGKFYPHHSFGIKIFATNSLSASIQSKLANFFLGTH